MPSKRAATSRIHTEATLRKLSDLFLSFSIDPGDNINMMVAGLGEMLGADCCIYNRLDHGKLSIGSQWQPGTSFPVQKKAAWHICKDVMQNGGEDTVLIQNLEQSRYAETDPYIRELGLKTYFGKVVELSGEPIGSLCTAFTTNFKPGPENEELIGIISSAIAVQESLQQKMGEIRDREHRLQALIDNSPNVAIQFYGADGIVKYWNKASEAFYGFSGKETKGRSLAELILSKEGYAEFLQTLKKIDHTGETIISEWTITDKLDNQHHIQSTLFAIDPLKGNNSSKDFICMDVDLTDLKNAERKLKEYTLQLENLNATKDKFFSIIAHDLKNPFNTILGFSRILFNDYNELNDDEILKFIRAIRDSSENAFKLLQNLLVWSRIQTGHVEFSPEICSLNLIVSETLALLKPQASAKNIHVVSVIDPSIQVHGDENMIKTIFRNLISNAIKYTHMGGEVAIRATCLGKEVKIDISDNGIGMSPQLLSRLFRIGENTERPGTANEMGTGLGLILCKEFLQKHNTDISVQSESGKGTVFSFILNKYHLSS